MILTRFFALCGFVWKKKPLPWVWIRPEAVFVEGEECGYFAISVLVFMLPSE